ncbi:MAG: phosphate ABC transporter permease PstA [Alphaproteobacteria bacterium]|nr:phosphate ABC transporter permease PstA [Alphaproteobacteria bacterium]
MMDGRATLRVPAPSRAPAARPRHASTDLAALGEPYLWTLGGCLALGIAMVAGLLLLVFWNGALTFWPQPIAVLELAGGERLAGVETRGGTYRPRPDVVAALPPTAQAVVAQNRGLVERTLYRTGNFDLYGDDFRWVSSFQIAGIQYPTDMLFVERLEWGVFIGRLRSFQVGAGEPVQAAVSDAAFQAAHAVARARAQSIRAIERHEIGRINNTLERERLGARRVAFDHGEGSGEHQAALARLASLTSRLEQDYAGLAREVERLKAMDAQDRARFADVGGREKEMPLSQIVRLYAANDLNAVQQVAIYLARWWEFVSDEPREANTEGGVWPAIFGTLAMTLLMVVVVAPFGVVTALYLREYAKQGRLVSIVRISVNNLAGVPSIVYGVFGLGFFAYFLGGSIDQLFFPERLPSPTFGTGGLLWSSLTLALLTVPVVIVATEEAIAAVPRSMREGSLACGASKWQTIRHIVLPRAMPGIMTGIILAMARGASEVAPLMLVGVVKLAPELPIDGTFPYLHPERSFMHLGFHIYDVGFQSRNSEAGKPMVFVTTLLLITLITAMTATAIVVRARLSRKFAGSQF